MAVEKKWYVLRVRTGKEEKVRQYIESEKERSGLGEYIERVLIPKEREPKIKNGRRIFKEKIMYSGYVFVEADLTREVAHKLKDIPEALNFLGSGSGMEPMPLSASEVEAMLSKVDKLAQQSDDFVPFFTEGDKVKVVDGPFNTFEGVVEAINNEKKKLRVMVRIFGRGTPLELDFIQVEKMS